MSKKNGDGNAIVVTVALDGSGAIGVKAPMSPKGGQRKMLKGIWFLLGADISTEILVDSLRFLARDGGFVVKTEAEKKALAKSQSYT